MRHSVAVRLAEKILLRAPARTRAGGRLVLAYHNIVPADVSVDGDRSLHLRADLFAEQLRIVQSEASLVSLEDLLKASSTTRDKLVAVTFDDAYRSALLLGLPLCAAEGVGATVFVAPGILGAVPAWDEAAGQGAWSDEERSRFLWTERGRRPVDTGATGTEYLRVGTEEQLRQALKVGIHRVANHTFWHPNLGALPAAEVAEEVERANDWLLARFPAFLLPYLAYPYGIPPRDISALAELPSVEYAFIVSGGRMGERSLSNRFQLPRWNVPAGISRDGFRLRLRGWLVGR